MSAPVLPLLATTTALAVAMVTDLRQYKIPNVLTVPLIVTGGIYQYFSPCGQGLVYGILGLCVATIPLLVMHFRGAMGAGDVKLAAGLGIWLGPVIGLNGAFTALVVHAVFSLVALAIQRRVSVAWSALKDTQSLLTPSAASDLRHPLTRIPFSIGIAIGFLSALVFRPLP